MLYDEIEPNKEVSFLLPFRGTDVEQELETTQNQQIIDSDTNLYVDCPNNVYDKMFVSRSHVNENQGNVYHKVDLRNNRYSLVKPIGTETSSPKWTNPSLCIDMTEWIAFCTRIYSILFVILVRGLPLKIFCKYFNASKFEVLYCS